MDKRKNILSGFILMAAVLLLAVCQPVPAAEAAAPVQKVESAAPSSHEEAVAYVRNMLKSRTTGFALTVDYTGVNPNLVFDQIMQEAQAESSSTPADEGDYIKSHVVGYSINASYNTSVISYTVTMQYSSNAEQEAQVSQKLAEVMASLGLTGKSDYEKVKLIHDYIINNTDYINDGTTLCHSAYSSLIRGQAVCQGYAGLFQRMCKEAGIEARYITGYGGGEAHAWNIVKVDGKWYNIDVTWDDPVGGSLMYDFFLKSEADFTDHTRDAAYAALAFTAAYPMAEFSYGESAPTKADGMNVENPSYTFMGIDGNGYSSAADQKAKLIIFFNTQCGYSQATLRDIAASQWAASGVIDIYAVDAAKHTRAEVEAFKNQYCPQGNIQFCYDEDGFVSSYMWDYAHLAGESGSVYYPLIFMIDSDNKLQFHSIGIASADRLGKYYIPLLVPEGTLPDNSGNTENPDNTENPHNPAQGSAFSDVPYHPGNWKYDAVQYVFENGIMNGISGTDRFDPDSPLNRAMFATVLHRMAGLPAAAFQDIFADVADGKYYSKAIMWVNAKQIATGMGNGSFGVSDNITREQIAKMLYEFGKAQGYNVSSAVALDEFTDAPAVSSWAAGYMKWAVSAGMITGKPNGDGTYRLDPQGQATRAECAKMLMMFMKAYGS